ncbi:MAG: hypothetical protein LBU32_27460 [Clostridiales bacterium]|nr:hypothetical protein [Clostridiales bacterium]
MRAAAARQPCRLRRIAFRPGGAAGALPAKFFRGSTAFRPNAQPPTLKTLHCRSISTAAASGMAVPCRTGFAPVNAAGLARSLRLYSWTA